MNPKPSWVGAMVVSLLMPAAALPSEEARKMIVTRTGSQPSRPGPVDKFWTPPGVKHWHGATASESMTHIAIQETVDGTPVHWMEKVSDEQYGKPAR